MTLRAIRPGDPATLTVPDPDEEAPGGRRVPRPTLHGPVVFRPPATPAEEADARRRWLEALDWLATLGALDA